MTLILSLAHRFGVTQVVDRLVTPQHRRRGAPSDSQFNKTVVFAALDAVVIISFTGAAYIGDTPTDRWIAQTLVGRTIEDFSPGEPWTFQGWKQESPWPSLGIALKGLQEKMSQALRSQQNPGLKFVILGWQFYGSKRARPLAMTVMWKPGSTSYTVDSIPRHIGRYAHLTVEPEGYLNEQEQNALLDSMNGKNSDGVEAEMISALRAVSRRSRGRVGPDCVCVSFTHPSRGLARVRYDSPTVLQRPLSSSIQIPLAFTPWIINPGSLRAASIVSGPSITENPVGPYRLLIFGTGEKTDPRQPSMFQMGQPRRKRPT